MKHAPGCAQVLKEHADSRLARDAVARLTPVVTAQREKVKEEMFGAPHARQHAGPCMQAYASPVSLQQPVSRGLERASMVCLSLFLMVVVMVWHTSH